MSYEDCPFTLANLAATYDNISTSTAVHSSPDYTSDLEGDYDYADLNCAQALFSSCHTTCRLYRTRRALQSQYAYKCPSCSGLLVHS